MLPLEKVKGQRKHKVSKAGSECSCNGEREILKYVTVKEKSVNWIMITISLLIIAGCLKLIVQVLLQFLPIK